MKDPDEMDRQPDPGVRRRAQWPAVRAPVPHEVPVAAAHPPPTMRRRHFSTDAALPDVAGRWRARDHNTLGEGRAVIKLLDGVVFVAPWFSQAPMFAAGQSVSIRRRS